jgi:hypothetical protein
MEDELLKEERKLRRLRLIVDFAMTFIATQNITHDEAIRVVEAVKRQALMLFPDKEETFDLIYLPRFRRLLNERFRRS